MFSSANAIVHELHTNYKLLSYLQNLPADEWRGMYIKEWDENFHHISQFDLQQDRLNIFKPPDFYKVKTYRLQYEGEIANSWCTVIEENDYAKVKSIIWKDAGPQQNSIIDITATNGSPIKCLRTGVAISKYLGPTSMVASQYHDQFTSFKSFLAGTTKFCVNWKHTDPFNSIDVQRPTKECFYNYVENVKGLYLFLIFAGPCDTRIESYIKHYGELSILKDDLQALDLYWKELSEQDLFDTLRNFAERMMQIAVLMCKRLTVY